MRAGFSLCHWALDSYIPEAAVSDLPLCVGVLKHRSQLVGGGGIFMPKKFTMEFCLCGAILNLKAFCFGAIQGIMIELTACVGLNGLPPSGPR